MQYMSRIDIYYFDTVILRIWKYIFLRIAILYNIPMNITRELKETQLIDKKDKHFNELKW